MRHPMESFRPLGWWFAVGLSIAYVVAVVGCARAPEAEPVDSLGRYCRQGNELVECPPQLAPRTLPEDAPQ
jgi:hypothetical protein